KDVPPEPTEPFNQDEASQFARLLVTLDQKTTAIRVIDERYECRGVIGRGGMGTVFEAFDRKLECVVALKILRRSISGSERLREAKVMARLFKHANVIGLKEIGTHDGRDYLTMELAVGGTLREWCKRRSPSQEEILQLYLGAGRGLQAAHERAIVHRDFKADNVLIDEGGKAKVADFGLAAEQGHLTLAGIGTRAYMAPEQFSGGFVDARTDQFAYCVSLWQSLSGELPHGDSWRTAEQQLAALDADPAGEKKIPAWLRPILRRGMAKESADRFETLKEILDRIERRLELPKKLREAALLFVGGVVIAVAAVTTVAWLTPESTRAQSCDTFTGELYEFWNPARRDALAARASEAPQSIADALTRLDVLGEQWTEAAEAACVDEQAPAADAESRRCLERWLVGLDQSLELLIERGDGRTLGMAPELLENLSVPRGDFCARSSPPIGDPELERLVEASQAAARLGLFDEARERTEAALSRAGALAQGRAYTREQAQALAVQAELLARQGLLEEADELYRRAQAHALASDSDDVLAATLILWAKALSLSKDPANARRADDHLGQVEPLFASLELPATSLLRGELLEARALNHKYLGELEEADRGYDESAGFFQEAGYSIQAARSIYNRGALAQEQGNLDRAEELYRQALERLVSARVPENFPYLNHVHYNIGALALDRVYDTEIGEDDRAMALALAGLESLDLAIANAAFDVRIDALALAAQLAAEVDLVERARDYALQVLDELEHASFPVADAERVRAIAITSLLAVDSEQPAAEQLARDFLQEQARPGDELTTAVVLALAEFLARHDRCAELQGDFPDNPCPSTTNTERRDTHHAE
ncbi:MAG: protein kinase, partial [Myxococcales bacterium]|nr:protein kinase [Myxococcales bacterium]